MSIETQSRPTEAAADLKAMIEHAFKGKPLDADAARRVHERADRIRAELRARGIVINAADLIRETRDEL